MRRIVKSLLIIALCLCSFNSSIYAQAEAEALEFEPAYILISTMHWNQDSEIDFSEWKKTEREYFDKVTNKNPLIIGSGVYQHYITPDDTEIIFVSVFDSWEDIAKANILSEELIEQGWSDEYEREVFLKKQSSFYEKEHSDEIVTSLPFQKELITESEESLIYYFRKNKMGEGGSGYREFFDSVIMKNSYIKGYYTYKHLYGSNNTIATEIAVFESLSDFDSAFEETERLIKDHWPYENERKAFLKEFRKIFAGHGDFIYQNVPELAK